jgi:hypothetical protein
MITPITYAIHKEKESPIFGEDTIHVSAESTGIGIFFKIKNISPGSSEFSGENTLFLEEDEINEIVQACNLLKENIKE